MAALAAVLTVCRGLPQLSQTYYHLLEVSTGPGPPRVPQSQPWTQQSLKAGREPKTASLDRGVSGVIIQRLSKAWKHLVFKRFSETHACFYGLYDNKPGNSTV